MDERADDFSYPGSGSEIAYRETKRKDVIDQVRSVFRAQVSQLKMLEFDEFGFYRESVPWLGASMGLTMILGTLGVLVNEVTRLGPKLTINSFYILMASAKDSTYANISNLGINFCTRFTDGTCLTTSTYKGVDFQDEPSQLYSIVSSDSLFSACAVHKKWVKSLASGKSIDENMSMAAYFSIAMRFDQYMLTQGRR